MTQKDKSIKDGDDDGYDDMRLDLAQIPPLRIENPGHPIGLHMSRLYEVLTSPQVTEFGWLNDRKLAEDVAIQEGRAHVDRKHAMKEQDSGDDSAADQNATTSLLSKSEVRDDADPSQFVWKAWDVIQAGIKDLSRNRSKKYSIYDGNDQKGTGTLLDAYQKEGVAHLEMLEESFHGWLLADEMGLAKTYQCLELLARDKSRAGKVKPTLLILSISLVQQWWESIQVFPTLKALKYTTSEETEDYRTNSKLDFDDFDIVLTTYETMMSEVKKHETSLRDFKLLQAGIEKKHKETSKKKKGIVPEEDEPTIDCKAVRHSLPLLTKVWHRKILDDAHRPRKTDRSRFRALQRVRSTLTGCITGTPVQKEYKDFLEQLSLLKIKPFDDLAFFERCFISKTTD